jgi:phosphatidylserine/phosphatidylglycerophosphate/cardiolipin synthase-like enzyme
MNLPYRVLVDIDQITRALLFMIKEAREELVIVSPYIQLQFSEKRRWKEFDAAIGTALNRGVKISFISRERDASTTKDAMNLLKEYRGMGCSVYLVPNLHAKIYWNETIALVTSMNLYYGSTIKNHEIGIIIDNVQDHDAIKKYIVELESASLKTSIDGGRVSSKHPAPTGLKKTFFKITGKGTKYYRIKLEGKYPGMIEACNVDVVLEKGFMYDCTARVNWRTVGSKKRVYLDAMTGIKKRVE